MNFYSLAGFSMALVVLIYGLFSASDTISIFWDTPSLLLVVGGTFAATSISFQVNRIFKLFMFFVKRQLFGTKPNYKELIKEIMIVSEIYRKGEALEEPINSSKDFFLKESLTLVQDNILTESEVVKILDDRAKNLYYSYMEDANRIKTIGKYPPAFGMMGTTIGMIVLLANLSGADAMKKIGPAMGICLITTLYGVVVANLAVIPISDNLIDSSKEIYLKNRIIIEGIRLMLLKSNPVIVAERLNSFLQPSERLDWKEVMGSKA